MYTKEEKDAKGVLYHKIFSFTQQVRISMINPTNGSDAE